MKTAMAVFRKDAGDDGGDDDDAGSSTTFDSTDAKDCFPGYTHQCRSCEA